VNTRLESFKHCEYKTKEHIASLILDQRASSVANRRLESIGIVNTRLERINHCEY
jgi:hypothetical protein